MCARARERAREIADRCSLARCASDLIIKRRRPVVLEDRFLVPARRDDARVTMMMAVAWQKLNARRRVRLSTPSERDSLESRFTARIHRIFRRGFRESEDLNYFQMNYLAFLIGLVVA